MQTGRCLSLSLPVVVKLRDGLVSGRSWLEPTAANRRRLAANCHPQNINQRPLPPCDVRCMCIPFPTQSGRHWVHATMCVVQVQPIASGHATAALHTICTAFAWPNLGCVLVACRTFGQQELTVPVLAGGRNDLLPKLSNYWLQFSSTFELYSLWCVMYVIGVCTQRCLMCLA